MKRDGETIVYRSASLPFLLQRGVRRPAFPERRAGRCGIFYGHAGCGIKDGTMTERRCRRLRDGAVSQRERRNCWKRPRNGNGSVPCLCRRRGRRRGRCCSRHHRLCGCRVRRVKDHKRRMGCVNRRVCGESLPDAIDLVQDLLHRVRRRCWWRSGRRFPHRGSGRGRSPGHDDRNRYAGYGNECARRRRAACTGGGGIILLGPHRARLLRRHRAGVREVALKHVAGLRVVLRLAFVFCLHGFCGNGSNFSPVFSSSCFCSTV